MTDWRWKYFSIDELKCKHCGALIVVPEFLDRLEKLREAYGKPLKVSSGYRCSQHNNAVSKTGLTGPHTTGRAVDLLAFGKDAIELVRLATSLGFTGIGISQKGDKASRFVHLDDIQDRSIRPTIWSY